ncbi:MAG: hypothetical protein CL685_03350 [Candidatus Magasanikbacteria bacterium]|nr:hypothetical protein [Candidatus Magasanikbacteria bacterium]
MLPGGILLQYIMPWYEPIHWTMVWSTIISQIIFLGCPLVVLENTLRGKHNPKQVYSGSFVSYYLYKWLNLRIPPVCIICLMSVVAAITILTRVCL